MQVPADVEIPVDFPPDLVDHSMRSIGFFDRRIHQQLNAAAILFFLHPELPLKCTQLKDALRWLECHLLASHELR